MLSGTVHSSTFSRKLTKTKYEKLFHSFFFLSFFASLLFSSLQCCLWVRWNIFAGGVFNMHNITLHSYTNTLSTVLSGACHGGGDAVCQCVPPMYLRSIHSHSDTHAHWSVCVYRLAVALLLCARWGPRVLCMLGPDVPMEARSNAPTSLASARARPFAQSQSSRFCPPNHTSFLRMM